jgi:hypothetical protein
MVRRTNNDRIIYSCSNEFDFSSPSYHSSFNIKGGDLDGPANKLYKLTDYNVILDGVFFECKHKRPVRKDPIRACTSH